jgi:hypothetical protein
MFVHIFQLVLKVDDADVLDQTVPAGTIAIARYLFAF